jgi:hypothetical protein
LLAWHSNFAFDLAIQRQLAEDFEAVALKRLAQVVKR